MQTHFLDRNNDLDIEKAFTAMIATPSLDDAIEVLKEQGFTTTPAALEQLRSSPLRRDRYEQRRTELAPLLESMFANDLLDTAMLAQRVETLAIHKTRELLEAGRISDPSKVARDLSQVATQAVDKRLAIQGRPTTIVEHRDVNEILRQLEAMKVVQVIEGTVTEDDASVDA
jgi:hypothetical protein